MTINSPAGIVLGFIAFMCLMNFADAIFARVMNNQVVKPRKNK